MLSKYLHFSTILSFVLIIGNISYSQSVVHTESKRLDKDEDGFGGNIEMGLNFVQNVNNVLTTQNASQFHWNKNRHTVISVNALNLTVFNESKVLNDGMQHFRHAYEIKERFSWETFAQAQYNEIIKIKGRYLMGTGARFKVFDSKKDSTKLFLGAHYMREYEEETTGFINRHHRISSVVALGWPVNNKVEIDLIGYYQPDIMNFSDFRVSSEFYLKISIVKWLKFKYSMAWFYDANPPEGIRNIFYNIRNTLLFELN